MSRQELWGKILGGNSSSESGSYPKPVELPEQERAFHLRWLLHIISFLSLFVAWHYLSAWSIYWQQRDYFKFALFLTLAFWVGPARSVIGWLKYSSPRRLILVVGVAVMAMPWGEFLQRTSVTGRENWSQQILIAFAFIYGCLLLLQIAPRVADRAQEICDSLRAKFVSHSWLYWIFPLLFFGLCTWISLRIFQQIPVTQDSAAYLFQARIFAKGRLFSIVPRPTDFFSIAGDMLVMKDSRWFSMYLPGYPLALSLAVLLHSEFLLSPLLGALTVAIWISYARKWHEESVATIFPFLLVFSPFLFLMYSSVMIHTLELFLASVIIYLARRETEESSLPRMLLLSTAGILAVITRGFSLVPFLVPAIAYLMVIKIRRKELVSTTLIMVSFAFAVGLIAFYQWKTTGNPLTPGYNLETAHGYGLGEEIANRRLTASRALENTSNQVLGLNSWLTGWYSGSLFFILLYLLFARFEKWDVLILLGFVILLCFYFFYPVQDLVLGPRFYFCAAPFLLLLIARTPFLPVFRMVGGSSALIALLIVCILSFFTQRFFALVQQYDRSGTVMASLQKEMKLAQGKNVLIFLDQEVPQTLINWNDPFFENKLMISRDLGAQNQELLIQFPQYQPRYFRTALTLGGGTNMESGYALFDRPLDSPPGYVSLLQVALRMEAASGDRDCFDVAYTTYFHPPISDLRLAYLQKLLSEQHEQRQYKENFRRGMIHAAQLLLLPKAAYEDKGKEWQSAFDVDEFLHELNASLAAFRASDEVGKIMTERMVVISRRIDTNGDGKLTPQEVRAFVAKKLEEL